MSEFLKQQQEQMQVSSITLAREIFDRQSTEAQADELLMLRTKNEFIPMDCEGANNAVTAFFEELTAAGDLSTVRFSGDQDKVHRETLARLLNGFSEYMPAWEIRRRYAEVCEEIEVYQLFKKIKDGELPEETLFITISDAPDDATTVHEANDIGYRMGNYKGMVRSYHFERNERGEWVRVLEQLSRSNTNDGSTRRWFNENASAVPLHATGALHETCLASRSRLPDGVVSLTQELDGPDKIYGESWAMAAVNKRPNYAHVRSFSEERRMRFARFTNELAEHEEKLLKQLQTGQITYQEKLRQYYDKQDEIIDRVAIMDSDFARDARGEATVTYYQQAGFALHRGDLEGFRANIHTARRLFESNPTGGGTACGGKGARRIQPDNPESFDAFADELFEKSTDDASSEEWRDGVCRVPSCGYKGKVGPCSICKACENRFKAGDDPTKDVLPPQKANAQKTKGWISWMLPNLKVL